MWNSTAPSPAERARTCLFLLRVRTPFPVPPHLGLPFVLPRLASLGWLGVRANTHIHTAAPRCAVTKPLHPSPCSSTCACRLPTRSLVRSPARPSACIVCVPRLSFSSTYVVHICSAIHNFGKEFDVVPWADLRAADSLCNARETHFKRQIESIIIRHPAVPTLHWLWLMTLHHHASVVRPSNRERERNRYM